MTMKIYLLPKDSTPADILELFDIDRMLEISLWLSTLSKTRRGNAAFRICNYNGSLKTVPSVVFVRREDFIAFRLKFGL